MRKWTTFLMTLLVGASISSANANNGQVVFEAGYRHDNYDWSHRFPSSDPVIKTHTRFKDVDIFQIGLKGRTTLGCNFYLRANAYWGWVLDGDFNRNISTFGSRGYDNSGFNEGFEFSQRHDTVVDDKYVYGVGAALGYAFYFCDCTLALAPVVGYSVDEQNLRVEDEEFNFSRYHSYVFPVSGEHCCRHTTIFRWYGPFVGVDFTYRPWNECWDLYAELEYHWGYFRGKRDHEGFDFFDHRNQHSKDADAWVFTGGADYDLGNCWTLGFSVKFQGWWATRHHRHDDGGYGGSNVDYLFSGGSRCCNERHRTNAKWHSYAINLTLGRNF